MKNILFLLVLFVFVSNSQAIITTADLSVAVINQTPGQTSGKLEMTITNNGPDTVMPEFVVERNSMGTYFINANFSYDCRFTIVNGTTIQKTINGHTGSYGSSPSLIQSGESLICGFFYTSLSPPVIDTYDEGKVIITVGHQTQIGETFEETNWEDNTVEFSIFEPVPPQTDLELNVILDQAAPHPLGTVGEMSLRITNHGPDVYAGIIQVYTRVIGEPVTFYTPINGCGVVESSAFPVPGTPVHHSYGFYNFPETEIQVNQTISCQVGYVTSLNESEFITTFFHISPVSPITGYGYFGDLNLDNNTPYITFGDSPVPQIIPSLSLMNLFTLLCLFLAIAFCNIKT